MILAYHPQPVKKLPPSRFYKLRHDWQQRMLSNWVGKKCFQAVHRSNLVYNTCWEDPRLDREAMSLCHDDKVMVITSAGCNALDYVLDSPAHVFAVDMNPLQNALLDLKIACIRTLDFSEFFSLFGHGCMNGWADVYRRRIRPVLSTVGRECWDARTGFFDGQGRRNSFYFHGSSGYFAWLINAYIDRVAKVRETLQQMLDATSVSDQKQLFDAGQVRKSIWRPMLRWLVGRDLTMSMLGVPRAQRDQIDRDYPGGLEQFIISQIEYVFTNLSLADNYFWRVYLTGSYSENCCPEYLKEANFNRLRDGLVDRVSTHTDSVEGFLKKGDEPISRFVLLDHMDWMCKNERGILSSEWQAIINRSAEKTKVLWRSAGLQADFINPLQVSARGRRTDVGNLLTYHTELASSLHLRDRVHTYGSFYIADLNAA